MISIITVSYKDRNGLKKTLASVNEQRCNGYIEHIVIDGGSGYDLPKLMGEFDHRIKYISEKDGGIYDAMNKGLRLAAGEYVLFLNSGDVFASASTVSRLINASIFNNGYDLIYSDALEEDITGKVFKKSARSPSFLFLGMFTHHQAMIFKRNSISFGYNANYRIAGDYALVATLLKSKKAVTKFTEYPICIFERGGISQTQAEQGRNELISIQKSVLGYGQARLFTITALLLLSHKLRLKLPFLYNKLRFKQGMK